MPVPGARELSRNPLQGPDADPQGDVEPLSLPNARIFQATMELDRKVAAAFIPSGLRVPSPAMIAFGAWAGGEPGARWALAQVRVQARVGVRGRGIAHATFFEGDPALAERLRAGWGFACEPASIALHTSYDVVSLTVSTRGKTLLAVELRDPQPISPSDLELPAIINPARIPVDGGERKLRFVQVDPELTVTAAHRGRPALLRLAPELWSAMPPEDLWPVIAVAVSGDIRLAPARFIVDPEPAGKALGAVPGRGG
jgi:hypothetical protein